MKTFLQGTFWLSISKVFNQIFSLIFFIILARLLDPGEFGKAALLFSYLNISQALFRGLEFNWIQHKIQKKADLSTALIIALIYSFILGLAVFFIFVNLKKFNILNLGFYDNHDFLIMFVTVPICILMILRGELSKRNELRCVL